MKSKKGLIGLVQLIKPQDLAHTTTKSSILDTQNCGTAEILLSMGVFTGVDGSNYMTPKLQESNTTAEGDFTDVAAADIDGAFTVVNSTAKDETIQRVAYRGSKRYVRAVLTYTGTGITASLVSVSGLLGLPSKAPFTAPDPVAAT